MRRRKQEFGQHTPLYRTETWRIQPIPRYDESLGGMACFPVHERHAKTKKQKNVLSHAYFISAKSFIRFITRNNDYLTFRVPQVYCYALVVCSFLILGFRCRKSGLIGGEEHLESFQQCLLVQLKELFLGFFSRKIVPFLEECDVSKKHHWIWPKRGERALSIKIHCGESEFTTDSYQFLPLCSRTTAIPRHYSRPILAIPLPHDRWVVLRYNGWGLTTQSHRLGRCSTGHSEHDHRP